MKSFNSLESLSLYIKNQCFEEIINEVGKKTEETMKEVTESQVQGDTGDIINCIGITEQSNDSVTVAWQDNGNWFSESSKTKGQHMYAPWALENGKTFEIGKPMFKGHYHEKTTLVETSKEIMTKESVDIARRILSRKGFKV